MPNNGTYQNNNTILGQSTTNPKAMKVFNVPDTDCRQIKISGGATSITPNFMYDHCIVTYVAPINNTQTVHFNYPAKIENRSLHSFILDNRSNNNTKTFSFSADYVFLDDPSGNNIYDVDGGKVLSWYGAVINGKFYLRLRSDSTN